MSHRFYTSEVIDIIDEAPEVKRFVFRIPELDRFDFLPGQFVMINLPLESKITTRAYSIASPPLHNNTLELVIAHKTGGLATEYLFNTIKKGSEMPMSPALGKFVLQAPAEGSLNETELCFICTGTGVAPFRSMLLDLHRTKTFYKKIHLVFGCRHVKDILYYEEMLALQKEMEGFNFIPVLSREQDSSWKGEKGYVHPVYKKMFSGQQPAMFYLCGWKEMVKEAAANIQQMGYNRSHIHFEVYD